MLAFRMSFFNMRRITLDGSSAFGGASLAIPWMKIATTALAMISIAIMAHSFLSANMDAAIRDLFPGELAGCVTGLTSLLFPVLTWRLFDHFSCMRVFILIAFTSLLGTVALFAAGTGSQQSTER